MAFRTLISKRGAGRRAAFTTLFAAVALAVAPGAEAYGWPVKPFDQQHPVRGFFGDPRIGATEHGSHSLHFGIDVSARDGTAVYATLSGRIYVEPEHPETVAIKSDDGTLVFAYWHVVPTVRTGQRAVAYRTVIGHVGTGWGHVHFAETRGGVYLNPLRPGALGPYRDRTRPTIHAVAFERGGTAIDRERLAGRFDLVVEAYDETPLAVPAPWTGKPVAPAVVHWRIIGRAGAPAWRTAADFRYTIPSAPAFDSVFARWTRQNKASRRGRYRFYLAQAWNSASLPDGSYRIEVRAMDTRGNCGSGSATFTIRNR
jgi:hypothetical protein